MGRAPIAILLIEDNPHDVELLKEALAKDADSPVTLEYASQLSIGLHSLRKGRIDLVLLDLFLPDSRGLETIQAVRRHAPWVPIVVLTASDDDALAVQALQNGAQDYLVKGYVQVYRKLLGRSIRYAIERKRSEEDLLNANARTQQILSSLPSILIEVNPDGLVTHWNAVAERTFGIPSAHVLNRPLADAQIRWDMPRILRAVAGCRIQGVPSSIDDVSFTRPNDREGFLGLTFIPMKGSDEAHQPSTLLFGADVTQRKEAEGEQIRLQRQLIQAQKMEIVGRFAGGLSHDFNNFLQVILGFACLIRTRYEHHAQLMADVQEIVHAAESASSMVRQLLAFSRRQPLQMTVLDLNQTVRNMERLLQQLMGERIQLVCQLAPDPCWVKMDPTGIEQILMNLGANARDAMPEGGTLTIQTSRVTAAASSNGQTPHPAASGACVQLTVRDTGAGIDPEVVAHIFEPFFTTKSYGKGTGLGLAVVYGLVRQHQGTIDIDSAIGQGTTFHLLFPAAPCAPSAAPAGSVETSLALEERPAGPHRMAEILPRLRRHLLVVDDDEPIRVFCERTLGELYDVTTAPSAREALHVLSACAYDLLLTDLRMPTMDGVALLTEVARLHPSLKTLAMTGSLTDDLEQRLRAAALNTPVLHKPFLAPVLLEAVHKQLNGGERAQPA